jgi:ParB-like chromosome segregation protein Spo0J
MITQNLQIAWRNDPDAETILRDIAKLPFQEDYISLNDIDWSESANNCARLTDPLNHEKIEDYATCMRAGDAFPRIVVERHKRGKYVVLGGNQRTAAVKSIDANAVIECYVVDPLTSGERELVIRSLNSRHGWGSTKEERIEHAVFLVRKYGVHIDAVSRAMVVSDHAITQRIRAEDERARLAKDGIDASKVAIKALSALASVPNESLRNSVAKAAIEAKANAIETADLAKVVAKSKSKAAAVSAIADFKKAADAIVEIKSSRGGELRKPRREKLLHLLTTLADFLERGNGGQAFATLDELSCSVDHDLDNVRVLTAKITSRLHCICEAGK